MAEQQVEVKTFMHARKGKFRGAVVGDLGDWVDVMLVGDQTLTYLSIGVDPRHVHGEIVRMRKSFLTEVES